MPDPQFFQIRLRTGDSVERVVLHLDGEPGDYVPVPMDHPMMQAWEGYVATEDFTKTKQWVAHPDHVTGSLWGVFVAGFIAGAKWQKPQAEEPETVNATCGWCGEAFELPACYDADLKNGSIVRIACEKCTADQRQQEAANG